VESPYLTVLPLLVQPKDSQGSTQAHHVFSIMGQSYHRIFDVTDPSHSLHWFLYDERERERCSSEYNVPHQWISAVTADLEMCNPYVPQLHRFNSVASGALELSNVSSNGDFAAIMHGSNTTAIEPRHIVVWKNHGSAPTFVSIFSHHYELSNIPFFSHMALLVGV
jgi:hypothetical protein